VMLYQLSHVRVGVQDTKPRRARGSEVGVAFVK